MTVTLDPPVDRRTVRGSADLLLAIAATSLFVLASLLGLLRDGIYQDTAPVATMLRGYDLITLVLVVPTLGVTLLHRVRDRPRALLLRIGLLAFGVYNYALYLFGTEFNAVLLVHIGAFTLALYALIVSLVRLDVANLAAQLRPRTPVRTVAAILLVLAVGLGGMWIAGAVDFALTGRLPEEGSQLVLPISWTHLAYVLDLALLVPGYALAAVLLWRRRPWGYPLATMLLVAGVVSQVAYMAALIFQASAGVPGAVAFDPIEPAIALIYLAATAGMLASLASTSATRSWPRP